MTKKEYMNAVAKLHCATCLEKPVQLHHVREGVGLSQKNGDFLVIPLCPDCHTGPQGVHGDKTMMKVMKTDEMKILNETIGLVVANLEPK